MYTMARQILWQANDRQVKIRLLVDCDHSVLDEFLTRGQLRVLTFPQGPVGVWTREQPRQNVKQSDVQFARQLGIREFEETSRLWRRVCICKGGKRERDPGRLTPRKNPKIPRLGNVNEHVTMMLRHGRFQHRKNANQPVFVEVVIRYNVGFNLTNAASAPVAHTNSDRPDEACHSAWP